LTIDNASLRVIYRQSNQLLKPLKSEFPKKNQHQLLPIFIVCIVFWAFFIKNGIYRKYIPLFPGIKLYITPQFSVDKLNRISVGMSRKEVLELLGEPSYKAEILLILKTKTMALT
jgi:hypothetical protein